ncbi:MAG: hypothetical protein ACD_5C00239G0002 [uncultured bacterium]|nr:MAG: hypothetical protein ACD_5C00239G0002 [uncultured bacterium]
MKKNIQEILKKALFEAKNANNWPDFEIGEILVEYPKNEQFGDYTSNLAMNLARVIKKSPMDIAEKISFQLLASSFQEFEKIEVAQPGYLNFYLSKKYLQDLIVNVVKQGNNFANLPQKNEKVMIEYSQPNTHKEFHIGHLRNVFIGSALVNVLRKGGYDVTAANYIGDTGTHIAKCLWGIKKFHSNEDIDNIVNKAEFLGKVYTQAVKAITENPEYENEFKLLQKEFEKGDDKLVKLWEKTKEWSLQEFREIYNTLDVNFDVYFWESEEEQAGKIMLPELLKTNVIEESQGAIVANLEEYNLSVLVLARKDGSALYGLKDIPLAIKKFKEFKIDKSIVVVDMRQSLYFKQIFKILELIGFKKEMYHVGYEFVSLKGSEMMSSRKGNIIPAKSLINDVVGRVREKFPQANNENEIGVGALKFYMLKYSSQSKIEFDIEESVSLNGATGPYVQYAHARICSILAKVEDAYNLKLATDSNIGADLSLLVHEKEMSLIKELNKFPELIEEISNSYDVHKLPHYAIKLADKFHSFYDACRVIDEENIQLTKARIMLVLSVKIVLSESLRLIGVSAPEKM